MTDPHDSPSDAPTRWSAVVRGLRERRLVQWTVAYAAAAFAALQLIDILGHRFGWPEGVVRAAIVLLGAGLVLTVVVAWFHGERGRQRVSRSELSLIVGVCLVAVLVAGAQVGRGGGTAGPAAGDAGLAAHGIAADAARGGVVALPAEVGSVAVLPFANVSDDPERDYFSDGLTDELIGALSKVEGLKVAARTSAFRFKGVQVDAREVGRALGVATVLEGSVRVAGDRLRVTATLVGAGDGYHLWSERFDGELGDIFAIQDEISRAIVDALRVRLRPGAAGPVAPPPDMEAYELYLRGRYFANRRGEEALVRATSYFERAIALAPDWAPPYAGLADAAIAPRRSRPEERFRLGKEAALRALELDPGLSAAHTSLGWIRMWYDRDWDGARASFEHALALDPGYIWANQWYSAYLAAVGRLDDAMVAIRRTHALDPLAVAAVTHVGTHHLWLHEYDAALSFYRSALELDPAFAMARGGAGRALLALGRDEEAMEALRHEGADYAGLEQPALLAYALAVTGDAAAARQILARLHARARVDYVAPANIAIVHLALGEHDAALDWLERVEADRGALVFLKADPIYDPLRGKPRFQGLLGRMRLE
jgi:TolB-like protein/lipoprotein NlpI